MLKDGLRSLYARVLYGGGTALRDYEFACLQAWRRELSDAGRERLDAQLALLSTVKREAVDKLVLLHAHKREWYADWPERQLFPLRGEKHVARISVGPERAPRRAVKADIVLFEGRLFSVEFDKPPRAQFERFNTISLASVRSGTDLPVRGVAINSVDLFLDPMVPAKAPAPARSAAPLPRWLKELSERWPIDTVRGPITQEARNAALKSVDARLPAEYLELNERADGVVLRGCVILGLSQIWSMPRPDATFYVLAELQGRGSIAVRQGDTAGELEYLDNENDVPEPLGTSFLRALERKLA